MKNLLCFLFFTILIFSCSKDDDTFVSNDAVKVETRGPKLKVTICHQTGSVTNPFTMLELNENASNAHIENHGDFLAFPVFLDGDGDGFGTGESTGLACEILDGFSDNADDCDDTNSTVNPDAEEICDGVDNDCDDATDEGLLITCYEDNDGDEYGNADSFDEFCECPEGYSDNDDDCDDTNPDVNPDGTEECDNGLDDDCQDGDESCCGNGVVDPGEECDGGDNCLDDCTLAPICGDGVLDYGEECDDGNNEDGDGCNSICQIEYPTCEDEPECCFCSEIENLISIGFIDIYCNNLPDYYYVAADLDDPLGIEISITESYCCTFITGGGGTVNCVPLTSSEVETCLAVLMGIVDELQLPIDCRFDGLYFNN